MGLNVDNVTAVVGAAVAEDMVEAHLHQGGGGRVGGDMPAQAGARIIGLKHHGHGVPANDVLDTLLDIHVARIRRLQLGRNGVPVGGVEGRGGGVDAGTQGPLLQQFQKLRNVLAAVAPVDRPERIHPLLLLAGPVFIPS